MLKHPAWLIILATVACGTSNDPHAQTMALLPSLDVRFSTNTGRSGDSILGVLGFSYASRQENWPYGAGFAVTDPEGENVLWIYLHNGDYPPHTVHQVDFDADGLPDLFFYAGFEDVFETHIYLNRIASNSYAVSNFALGYKNDGVYAPVGDFDGDGKPELLVPEPQGTNYYEEDVYCGYLEYPDIVESATAEYDRVLASFDSLNNRYGMRAYRAINMFVLDKIAIFSLHGSSRWVTADRRDHLRWRRSLLDDLMNQLDPACRRRAQETADYLDSFLER